MLKCAPPKIFLQVHGHTDFQTMHPQPNFAEVPQGCSLELPLSAHTQVKIKPFLPTTEAITMVTI